MSINVTIRLPDRVALTRPWRGATPRFLRNWPRWLLAGVLFGLLGLVLFPVAWMISIAFKPYAEIYTGTPALMPIHPTLANFQSGWAQSGFSRYFANSMFVAVSRVVLSVLVNTLAGYGFAKCQFRGRDVLFVIALTALMVPEQVRMIPLYMMMGVLHWMDTFQAVILPSVGVAFGTFLMKQYMDTIPAELLDAGRIDGASELRLLWQIVVPLAVPAVVVNVIFQFMWGWNDLLYPLLFLRSREHYTVQLALALFRDDVTVGGGPIMAMALLATLPMLVVFITLQRYFVQGIALTGLK